MAHSVKLRDLGPDYLRLRMLNRDSALQRRNRLSAVELLEQSKKQFVKTESLLDGQQTFQKSTTEHQDDSEKMSEQMILEKKTLNHPCDIVDGDGVPQNKTSKSTHCFDDKDVVSSDDLEYLQFNMSHLNVKRHKPNETPLKHQVDTDDTVMCHKSAYKKRCTKMNDDHCQQNSSLMTTPHKQHHKSFPTHCCDIHYKISSNSNQSDLSHHSGSTDLRMFFDEMGLEHGILFEGKSSNNLSAMESVSTIDSFCSRSLCSNESHSAPPGLSSSELAGQKTSQTSVVERNARIIKWLCTVRKASKSDNQ